MNSFTEGSENRNLNSSKSGVRPSHETVEVHSEDAADAGTIAEQQLQHDADSLSKRGQNRIHSDEQRNPEDTLFTK